MITLIDLTRTLTLRALSYPGDRSGIAAATVDGGEPTSRLGRLADLDLHVGTHIDAPLHFVPEGADVAAIALALRPGIVVRAREAAVPARALPPTPLEGRAVLFDTGWTAESDSRAYFEKYPHLTPGLARDLVSRGVAVVGIDTPSVDPNVPGTDYPAHRILLSAGILIVEGLARLDRLPDGPDAFSFGCFPLKLAGADGASARAVAILGLPRS